MNQVLLIIALFLLSMVSAFADYGKFKEDLDTYQPPHAFLAPAEAEQDGIASNQAVQPVAPEGLIQAKAGYGQRLAAIGLDLVDENEYQRILGQADDHSALGKMLGKKVSLPEIKAIALHRNPGIQAAKIKVRAEIQSFDQVMNLDESLRQYSTFTRSVNTKVGPVKGKDSIKMTFPPPGLSALKGRIIESQVAVTLEKAAITAKTVLKDVESTFWDLIFVEKSIGITRETMGAFERLRDVATVLYRSGKTSFQDVIKINIKLEELKEDLVTLASRRQTLTVRMLELLDLPAVKLGRAKAPLLPARLPDVSRLYAMARENRQELNRIRHQIDKVSSMVEMAESMTEPRSDLGFSVFEADLASSTGTDAPKGGFSEKTMAAMKNSSPNQAWYGINEPWLAQTRQTLASLKQTLAAQENATDRMVRTTWFTADKNKREHALYRHKILPLAKSALDVSTREYEAGAIPFSQAIDSYTYWLKVKLTIAKKGSDYGTSFTELETITGKSLR
jgi:outer membrane protein TolC